MRQFISLLILLSFMDCMCQDFKLDMEFNPSFIEKSTLTVEKDSINCFISFNTKSFSEKKEISCFEIDSLKDFFRTYDYSVKTNGSSRRIRQYIDTKMLPDSNWIVLGKDTVRKDLQWNRGYIFDPDSNKYYSEIVMMSTYTDGITVHGQLSLEDTVKKINFFSPCNGEQHHFLTILLFRLMNQYFKNELTINYIERLEGYFGFGLGLKKLSNRPLTFKLYGFISLAEENDLIVFFDSLPKDRKVFIDMSNFGGMGTRFYENFIELNKTHNNIYWTNCSESVKKELMSLGFKESKFKQK
jgi:hypothetical protein